MKKLSFAALIFDVDGTLAETEETRRQAFNEAFRAYGLDWSWSPAIYVELVQRYRPRRCRLEAEAFPRCLQRGVGNVGCPGPARDRVRGLGDRCPGSQGGRPLHGGNPERVDHSAGLCRRRSDPSVPG